MDRPTSGCRGIYLANRLNDQSSRLFAKNTTALRRITLSYPVSRQGASVSSNLINNIDDVLRNLNEHERNDNSDAIILVAQEYSWGRLRITSDALREIMLRIGIFDDFLDVVNSYGIKTNDDERAFYGWRCRTSGLASLKQKYEFCYNLPYVQKHGRQLGDPWSLRQTGVYHQICKDTRVSQWIILNLADENRQCLEEVAQSKPRCCDLILHAEIFTMFASNWTEYSGYLSSELRKLNDKASYSSVDQTKDHGYAVTYQDLQELHMLQAKIERGTHGVNSCLEAGQACQHYYNAFEDDSNSSPKACNECLNALTMHREDMVRQLENFRRLQCRSENVLALISKILVFRNEILLQHSNAASRDTLSTLLAIAHQSRNHQETLTQLLAAVQADSILLKSLSIMATVYLPASLITGFFNSNLIQSTSMSANQEPTHLVLSPQFWIYVAISLPLVMVTLIWTLYLDRRSHRKVAAVAPIGILHASKAGFP